MHPAQRLILAATLLSTTLLTVTGGVLYLAPDGPRPLLAWMIRLHVAGAVALCAALAVHITVGSGLLPSHRGIARVMFGDGRVPVTLARRLWPGWTTRQLAGTENPPAVAELEAPLTGGSASR